jgi:hypothetical protein
MANEIIATAPMVLEKCVMRPNFLCIGRRRRHDLVVAPQNLVRTNEGHRLFPDSFNEIEMIGLVSGTKNLLVAGRAIGGDRVSHAAIRNMSCCAVTGQGAGIAAALSLKSKTDLYQIDIAQVQAELDRQGVRVF